MLEDILRRGFEELGLSLDDTAVKRYRIYYELLEETNRHMNLTAISGEDNVASLHFLDCAALLCYADLGGKSAIDVGTGAGFPGLALKIACPEMKLCLLDSLDKRIGFLKTCCEELGFEDVSCIHARAEEIPEGFREGFDYVLSRAVARLNLLSELCIPYVKPGGAFISMKGPELPAELSEAGKAIQLLGGNLERVESYHVPFADATHSLAIIRKAAGTSAKYPRRWAQIKKSPL